VNGPQVLSKFVDGIENNVGYIFADAEQDQRTRGNEYIYIYIVYLLS